MKRVIDRDCIRVFIVDKEDMSAETEFRYDYPPYKEKKELYCIYRCLWEVQKFLFLYEFESTPNAFFDIYYLS